VLGSFEDGKESTGSMKGEGFVDQLNDYQPPKKGSSPWSSLYRQWPVFFNNAASLSKLFIVLDFSI
jgi:hypothetical protein